MHVEVNGTRLWFDVEGPALVPDGASMRERPTVLLVHGGPGSYDHSYLKPDFGRLADVAQVVYLDLRDHGRSLRGDPAGWSFDACADDVPAFCEAVGIAAPVVLGHSLGGIVAIAYAARHPGHAGAIVLQSTSARLDVERIVEGFRRVGGDEVAEIARRSYSGVGEPVTREEWARCFRHFGPWVLGDEERSRIVPNLELNPLGMELLREFDAVDRLGAIDAPTLVSVGELDPVTPLGAAREILDGLAPGIGRLEVIPGAGHFPWKDAPDRYWPVLTDFVLEASRRA